MLIGKEVHESFELLPPFYTGFGQNISVGKNVFINQGCTFMDRDGITIEDNVLFAEGNVVVAGVLARKIKEI